MAGTSPAMTKNKRWSGESVLSPLGI